MSEVEERLQTIELELAERRPLDSMIKLFIYFLTSVIVVLGLVGLKQFSDIDAMVAEEVQLQFPRDKKRYLEYAALVDQTEDVNSRFQDVFGKYQEALNNMEFLDKVTDTFDIEGKSGMVIQECERRKHSDGLYDVEWRLDAISTLMLLSKAQKEKSFDPDFIFNAAQSASKLGQTELAYELMKAAYERRPNDAPVKAGMLSAIVEIGTEAEVDEAFAELMGMVVALDKGTPHIVLSEAWNAAENSRRYGEFIRSIDGLIERKQGVGVLSYAYIMKALALLRRSEDQDKLLAQAAYNSALDAMANESSHAVWFSSSLNEAGMLKNILDRDALTSVFIDDLKTPVEQ